MPTNTNRLVDAAGLLAALFQKESRPTERWVRNLQKRKSIPFYRIGRLIRFDVEEVRTAIHENLRVATKANEGN